MGRRRHPVRSVGLVRELALLSDEALDLGWTQLLLSKRAGVSQSFLSMLRTGNRGRKISLFYFECVANALGYKLVLVKNQGRPLGPPEFLLKRQKRAAKASFAGFDPKEREL